MPETLTETELAEMEARLERRERDEIAKHASPVTWDGLAALCRSLRAAWRWKKEASALLLRYDNLADTFNGQLGSLKVANLERGIAALRAQLQEEQNRNQIQADSIMDCEAEITSLRAQLAQAQAENERLASQLKMWQEEQDTKAGYL